MNRKAQMQYLARLGRGLQPAHNRQGYMTRRPGRIIFSLSLCLCGLLLANAVPGLSQNTLNQGQPSTDAFFIVSSVEAPKKQLVLKFPTEVTELIQVTDKTVLLNEQSKPLTFRDLRAGDTVYVTTTRGPGGTLVATRIRRGPMTVTELRRRYLKNPPVSE